MLSIVTFDQFGDAEKALNDVACWEEMMDDEQEGKEREISVLNVFFASRRILSAGFKFQMRDCICLSNSPFHFALCRSHFRNEDA
jgi:hypothetical protein